MDSVVGQADVAEIIVADHSSTDGTWELLQQYLESPRVRLIRTRAGGGAARNWNAATEAATGDWIKLVCGDDLLYPGAVTAQLAALRQADEPGNAAPVVVVASSRDVIDVNGDLLIRDRGLGPLRGRVEGIDAIRTCVTRGSNLLGEPVCTLLHRECLMDAGGWRGDRPYVIDLDMYFRMLAHGDLIALPGPWGAFRVSADQLSRKLLGSQAAEVAGLLLDTRREHPAALSNVGTSAGIGLAWIHAGARSLAYFHWRKRLSRPAATNGGSSGSF